jgi:prevent-host-death family protein
VCKIQLKDAKAHFSSVVDQATRGKPSVITRQGKPEAVVFGFADWERLSTFLWPAFDGGTDRAGGFADAQPRANARHRPVISVFQQDQAVSSHCNSLWQACSRLSCLYQACINPRLVAR